LARAEGDDYGEATKEGPQVHAFLGPVLRLSGGLDEDEHAGPWTRLGLPEARRAAAHGQSHRALGHVRQGQTLLGLALVTTPVHYTRSTAAACKPAREQSMLFTRDRRLVTCPSCLDSIARELLRRSERVLEDAAPAPA
jgi:hypothetical protein